jgi:biopolymer transport protein ExbD
MGLIRLRADVAAPLASMFLVLGLCAFVLQRPRSAGMHVEMLRGREAPLGGGENLDKSIAVLLHKHGSHWINETQVPARELGLRLAEIYENRKYKFTLVLSDPNVSFGEFAPFCNTVSTSTEGLRIELRTRQLEDQLQQCPSGGSCVLHSLDKTDFPCAIRLLAPPVLPAQRSAR